MLKRADAQMGKYDFEYCMKHDCNSCKRSGFCNNFENKNRHYSKRNKKKRNKNYEEIDSKYERLMKEWGAN